MRKIVAFLLVVLAAAALIAIPLVATAHRTGNERRNLPQCRTLRNPAKQRACIACVTRPRPHHFHPNAAPGLRCRLNNGLP